MSLIFESGYYAFGFYVALNALIMLVLSVLVSRARVATQTMIGDGGGNPGWACAADDHIGLITPKVAAGQ